MQGASSKIALDVVLIPPPSMTNHAIRMNRLLTGPECNEIRLGNADIIPHISLAMGCAGTKNLPDIQHQISKISKKTQPLDLTIDGIISRANEPTAAAMIRISLTREIQVLHEDLMKHLEQFFGEIADESAFFGPVKGNAVQWVNEYKDKSSFENFFPHITLGKGILNTELKDLSFTVNNLSLFQLGTHCTCSKILNTWDFKGGENDQSYT